MEKIVVDTSVLISALIGKEGPSRQVIRHCLTGCYKPVISTTLFLEYEDISKRAHILELCPLSAAEINTLLNAFYSQCLWIPIHYLWRPNLKDENDNFLIELAVASNTHFVISNNVKDLINAELIFDTLEILKPEELLNR